MLRKNNLCLTKHKLGSIVSLLLILCFYFGFSPEIKAQPSSLIIKFVTSSHISGRNNDTEKIESRMASMHVQKNKKQFFRY